jgi:hypothetical protein
MGTDDASLDLDLIAASLRIDAGDLDAFVESLALKLEEVLPYGVRVERRRAGLRGPKLVRRMAVDAGGLRFELRADNGAVDTRCSRMSGGIVLKTESVEIDAWLTGLGEALADEARRSQTTRQALERLLLR